MGFSHIHQPNSPHHFLAQLAGNWAGKTFVWLEPDGTPDVSQTQGTIQLILDGRFALYLYQGSIEGEPQHGMFTFGYNTSLDCYEASWVDSFHNNTAIMFCTGNASENGFWVVGSYPDPTGGPDWEWRTEVKMLDANRLTITAYNISPEGGETKAVETKLERVK
jgi:hypothetical protein